MNLLIDRKFPYDFVEKLKAKFKRDIILKLPFKDFTKIDIEMNEIFQLSEIVLSKEVILYALDNLRIIKRSHQYSIEFNPTINYPKTRIKLITLLNFISYGNSEVHGETMLIDEIKELNKDLDKLYKVYKLKGVVV